MTILYSIVPAEMVFANSDQLEPPQELIFQGQKVLAQATEQPGEFKLVQLISSDPALFLKPDFQPGTIIRYPAQVSREKQLQ